MRLYYAWHICHFSILNSVLKCTTILYTAINILTKLWACIFDLDKIYDTTSTNKELYDAEVQPIVEQFMKGINGTIFAYGQSSSGM